MKNLKHYLTAASIGLLAFVFCGCGKENKESVISESPQEYKAALEDTKSAADVKSLTDREIPVVCIDYAINSYDSVKDFAYHFFEQNLDEENPVLSPVSAYIALSMAGVGADGETRAEFEEILGSDMTVFADDLMNTFCITSEAQQISLANSAWLDNRFQVKDEWLGEIISLMDAEAYQTNLTSAEAVEGINHWIEENTNGLIEKMVEEPFPDETCLVLFNTLYFKARWEDQFESHMTYEDTFTLADGSSVETDMMHKYAFYTDYIENELVQGLVLPYLDLQNGPSRFAFVGLMPKDETVQIRDIYDSVTGEALGRLLADRSSRLVSTKLPKMEITFDQNLNESLQEMGLHKAFDEEKAEFASIGDTPHGENLYISLVRQKAKIIVDEKGTEAAAATEIAMAEGCALEAEEPVEVSFDRPFLYMVMDMEREIPLFIGIMDDPGLD